MKKTKKTLYKIIILFIIAFFLISSLGGMITYMFLPQTNETTNTNTQENPTQNKAEEQQLNNILNELFSGNNQSGTNITTGN